MEPVVISIDELLSRVGDNFDNQFLGVVYLELHMCDFAVATFDGNELMAVGTVCCSGKIVGEVQVPPGIMGLYTAPKYRRRGLIKKVFQKAHETLIRLLPNGMPYRVVTISEASKQLIESQPRWVRDRILHEHGTERGTPEEWDRDKADLTPYYKLYGISGKSPRAVIELKNAIEDDPSELINDVIRTISLGAELR